MTVTVICGIHCTLNHLTAYSTDMQTGITMKCTFNISCISLGYCLSAIFTDYNILALAFQVTVAAWISAANAQRRFPDSKMAVLRNCFQQRYIPVIVIVRILTAALAAAAIGIDFFAFPFQHPSVRNTQANGNRLLYNIAVQIHRLRQITGIKP